MMKIVEKHIRREAEALEEQRQGSVAITVGEVLLWMDLLLACFVYVGLEGAHICSCGGCWAKACWAWCC